MSSCIVVRIRLRRPGILPCSLAVLSLLPFAFAAETSTRVDRTVRFSPFGTVSINSSSPRPSRVALLISGNEGWNATMTRIAGALEAADTLVVGVDILHYLSEVNRSTAGCAYPSGDFEPLSHYVEQVMRFPKYINPILVGYQSGGTLAYAVLVQSPTGTFQGALSLGFRPDLAVGKSFCRGNGLVSETLPAGRGVNFQPVSNLEEPWIVLQGMDDGIFNPSSTSAFVKKVAGASSTMLPGIGHRFPAEGNWLRQLVSSFDLIFTQPSKDIKAQAPEVRDLPLVEIPPDGPARDALAVLLSGDGGWVGLDRNLGRTLAENGIAVVGFDSLQYYWRTRTPETAAQDLGRVLTHYLAAWKKRSAILVGYSFGADVLPFLAGRLPPGIRARVQLVALLGPSEHAEFGFSLTDWAGGHERRPLLPVLPEIEKLRGTNLLIVCGEADEESPCRRIRSGEARIVSLRGGHGFMGDYRALCKAILESVK